MTAVAVNEDAVREFITIVSGHVVELAKHTTSRASCSSAG